jgi:protein-serine/threonine kinase
VAATTTTASSSSQEQHNLAWCLSRSDGGVKKAKSDRVSHADCKTKRASFSCDGERSFSFVGTEEYVAPEVVQGDGHGFAVDWWALGVLVYGMSHGTTPFRGRSRRETFRNVLLREPQLSADARRRWPDLADLITRLLDKEPARRLGLAGGADEVRAHPFFAGVAWELLGEVSRPPYIPAPAVDVVDCEGFSVAEYFDKLHQAAHASPADRSPEPRGRVLAGVLTTSIASLENCLPDFPFRTLDDIDICCADYEVADVYIKRIRYCKILI